MKLAEAAFAVFITVELSTLHLLERTPILHPQQPLRIAGKIDLNLRVGAEDLVKRKELSCEKRAGENAYTTITNKYNFFLSMEFLRRQQNLRYVCRDLVN